MTLYYEVEGDGDPVVLLHGGMYGSEAWAMQRPALVEAGYRVFLPDRPGHGRTPDIDGPWTYEQMARDTIGFLDEVVGTKAHLIGWSDGAYVAALLAAERPDLVDRMVLIGQYFAPEGATGDLLTELAGFRTDPPEGVRREVVEKSFDLWSKEPTIPLSVFAGFEAPVLVLQGDFDEVSVEHSHAVASAIPQGRLAVLPGTHVLPLENPALVNALLISFLQGDAPRKIALS